MCIHADAKGKHQVAYSIYAASALTQESSSMPRTLLSSFDAGLEEEERTWCHFNFLGELFYLPSFLLQSIDLRQEGKMKEMEENWKKEGREMEASVIQGSIRGSSRVNRLTLSLSEITGKLRPQRYLEVCQTVKFILFICTPLQLHTLQGWFPLWVCGYNRVFKVVNIVKGI